jgi:hypothetical protein
MAQSPPPATTPYFDTIKSKPSPRLRATKLEPTVAIDDVYIETAATKRERRMVIDERDSETGDDTANQSDDPDGVVLCEEKAKYH